MDEKHNHQKWPKAFFLDINLNLSRDEIMTANMNGVHLAVYIHDEDDVTWVRIPVILTPISQVVFKIEIL